MGKFNFMKVRLSSHLADKANLAGTSEVSFLQKEFPKLCLRHLRVTASRGGRPRRVAAGTREPCSRLLTPLDHLRLDLLVLKGERGSGSL